MPKIVESWLLVKLSHPKTNLSLTILKSLFDLPSIVSKPPMTGINSLLKVLGVGKVCPFKV
jgi:hypothetical protein